MAFSNNYLIKSYSTDFNDIIIRLCWCFEANYLDNKHYYAYKTTVEIYYCPKNDKIEIGNYG